jgi:hypothetical protein
MCERWWREHASFYRKMPYYGSLSNTIASISNAHSIPLICYTLDSHMWHPRVTVTRQSDWALFTLGHPRVPVARQTDWALFTLGHPRVTVALQSDWALFTLGHSRVTVARQTDWALFTLGINSSQFCSRSLFQSRYWAYSPCADHHNIITYNIVFFCNKYVNIFNTQVLSHSTILIRRTNLYLSFWRSNGFFRVFFSLTRQNDACLKCKV